MKKLCSILLVILLLALLGCGGSARTAEATAAEKTPSVVSIESSTGGEVKIASSAPSNTPAPKSSVTFEKADEQTKYALGTTDGVQTLAVETGMLTVRVVAQALKCGISVAEGASVRLILSEGAAFTGTFLVDTADCAAVTLDETSTWTLTADTLVGGLTDANADFSNILSAGFSLSYDAEAAENASLAGGSKLLPGGGYLLPII